jgi:hypothetical protein
MGANIAGDIAKGELSEATIAYSVLDNALLLQVGAGGVGWGGLGWGAEAGCHGLGGQRVSAD